MDSLNPPSLITSEQYWLSSPTLHPLISILLFVIPLFSFDQMIRHVIHHQRHYPNLPISYPLLKSIWMGACAYSLFYIGVKFQEIEGEYDRLIFSGIFIMTTGLSYGFMQMETEEEKKKEEEKRLSETQPDLVKMYRWELIDKWWKAIGGSGSCSTITLQVICRLIGIKGHLLWNYDLPVTAWENLTFRLVLFFGLSFIYLWMIYHLSIRHFPQRFAQKHPLYILDPPRILSEGQKLEIRLRNRQRRKTIFQWIFVSILCFIVLCGGGYILYTNPGLFDSSLENYWLHFDTIHPLTSALTVIIPVISFGLYMYVLGFSDSPGTILKRSPYPLIMSLWGGGTVFALFSALSNLDGDPDPQLPPIFLSGAFFFFAGVSYLSLTTKTRGETRARIEERDRARGRKATLEELEGVLRSKLLLWWSGAIGGACFLSFLLNEKLRGMLKPLVGRVMDLNKDGQATLYASALHVLVIAVVIGVVYRKILRHIPTLFLKLYEEYPGLKLDREIEEKRRAADLRAYPRRGGLAKITARLRPQMILPALAALIVAAGLIASRSGTTDVSLTSSSAKDSFWHKSPVQHPFSKFLLIAAPVASLLIHMYHVSKHERLHPDQPHTHPFLKSIWAGGSLFAFAHIASELGIDRPWAGPYEKLYKSGISFGCTALSYWSLTRRSTKRYNSREIRHSALPSLILPCITSHRRLLPVAATHAFSYPLIYLGLDLEDLQSGNLNLPSRFFTYGAKAFTTVLGIRKEGYLDVLSEKKKDFKSRLLDLLGRHGVEEKEVGRVWMITMPSYLGFEGINPLTVYLCYAIELGREEEGRKGVREDVDAEAMVGTEETVGTPQSEDWVKVQAAEDAVDQGEESEMLSKDEGLKPLREHAGPETGRRLLCVVLEVHNTFGERHSYVLKSGHNEESKPLASHHRSWIFPRSFHVSPFNDRAGYYRLDLLDPFVTAQSTTEMINTTASTAKPSHPIFKITLNQLTPDKRYKLYAVLHSHPTRPPLRITARNIISSIILRQPFDLFLTTPRILYQAYLLHYVKKLLVYPRPEPFLAPQEGVEGGLEKAWNSAGEDEGLVGSGLGWLAVSAGEKSAERLVCDWLEGECEKKPLSVVINFANPARKTKNIGNVGGLGKADLTIWTRHPGFFTEMLVTRSPNVFLLLAETDKHTSTSDRQLFQQLFACRPEPASRSRILSHITSIRYSQFLFLASWALFPIPPSFVVSEGAHFIDETLVNDTRKALTVLWILATHHAAERAEEWVLFKMEASFVSGREPWGSVARAVEGLWGATNQATAAEEMRVVYGSALQDSGIET